jgi:uncharacterized protein (DUF362 family)
MTGCGRLFSADVKNRSSKFNDTAYRLHGERRTYWPESSSQSLGNGRFVKAEKLLLSVGWDHAPADGQYQPLLYEMRVYCRGEWPVMSDITCNDARRTFLRSGIKEAAEKAGAKVYLEAEEDFLTLDIGGQILHKWPVLKHFIQTDRLINMPIVKQHSLSDCTIGMKNFYGIIGGRRSQLHQNIDQSIVDLASFCRPTLTVVDATRVLLRGGPQGGSLADVAIENSVICSIDMVAADSRGCEFLGLSGDIVAHIDAAHRAGLGEIDYNKAGYKEIV